MTFKMKKYLKLISILLVLALFVITVIAPIKTTYTPLVFVSTGDPGGDPSIMITIGFEDVPMEIKPETINLASSGVFTVFVEFPDVKYPTGFEGLAGQTFSMKSDIQDLEMVLVGEDRIIYITGSISNGTEELNFKGSDTVRVISQMYH